MKRIILAYNPRSSKHARIDAEVVRPVQKLKGYVIGKYEIKAAPVDENVAELSKILEDGDFLIAAGGDGTATVGLNAIVRSKKDVTLGVLGYGNFNDFSRMVGARNVEQIIANFEKEKVQELHPLQAKVDGKIWRYAACYFTIGMFAESTEIFDAPVMRKTLRSGKKSLFYSVIQLAKWYFKNRKKDFLSGDVRMNDVRMNGLRSNKNISDILFVNGKTVAKVMKGGKYWQNPQEFFVSFGRLKNFFRLCNFMLKSMVGRMPGHVETREVKIDFGEMVEFEIQAEGEYTRVRAKELIVSKLERGVKVVVS